MQQMLSRFTTHFFRPALLNVAIMSHFLGYTSNGGYQASVKGYDRLIAGKQFSFNAFGNLLKGIPGYIP
jgi:hypothetical protein